MPRKKINPALKKTPVSVTLTPEQRCMLDWAAAQEHETASVLVGRLIEAEARRISRRSKRPLPPPPEPEQVTLDDLQTTPSKQVRDLIGGTSNISTRSTSRGRGRPRKNLSKSVDADAE